MLDVNKILNEMVTNIVSKMIQAKVNEIGLLTLSTHNKHDICVGGKYFCPYISTPEEVKNFIVNYNICIQRLDEKINEKQRIEDERNQKILDLLKEYGRI
jgi:hypothetical protein